MHNLELFRLNHRYEEKFTDLRRCPDYHPFISEILTSVTIIAALNF
jgi:hypothetical protein